MQDNRSPKGKLKPLAPEELTKFFEAMPKFESGLGGLSFGGSFTRDGPDFYKARKYSAGPRKVALREEKEVAANEALGSKTQLAHIRIPKNPNGPTNYEYIVARLKAEGVAIEAPLMKRQFGRDQLPQMQWQGTDRLAGMSLTSHRGGDDGEWLAMIEHGLKMHETNRTTYVSPLTDRDTRDLSQSPFGDCLAIYDSRGLMSCQPSHNKTDSFSNGHHLFVCDPKKALLAVIV
jgi:hypothetical protein